ncbi:MAG TPA: response regulator [Williamwhitmania sp.]|nr:response regulator [Williamwhitmania sp.]
MKDTVDSEEAVFQILIAEDSPTQAEQLRYALEKNSFEVIVAKNGKMALDLALEKLPAIVISDIVMPEMDGYELCKAIKSNETTSDIPVILLTSLSNSEDVLEGLACGADNFLTKPYSEKYLLSIIDQIIANKEFRHGDIVRVGVEISFGGKKRFITANQQQMLSLLISSYDAAVQKNSELVQAQEELRTINERLEELVEVRTADLSAEIEVRKRTEADLIVAKEKAEESDRLKTAFLHNISHEVRTPMNAIIGFSGFLSDPALASEKQVQFIDIITQSCYQLLGIITDIISIATIEAGQESTAEEKVDLNMVMNQTYEHFQPKCQSKGLTLVSENILLHDEVLIMSDEAKLLQILTKLLDNAIKFTKEGYVNFGYSVKEREIEIEFYVEDTGIGISPEMQQEIFKHFSQVESTGAREFGGSGLGLSISKAYVELLGGRVWLKSELGKGSTFYFTIPHKKTIAKIAADNQPIGGAKADANITKTLLIAEDEESNYMLLEEILSNLNLNLVWAKNGVEAISICKEQEIDLILMDIKMPVMDGFEATMKIKDFNPNMPIIAQTAYSTDFDRNKAFGCGCTDYISKPFKMDFIISKIKENLR